MHRLLNAAAVLLLLDVIAVATMVRLYAAPPYQGPPEEPTKAPYVFPTPIFIPTYPGDTVPPPTAVPVRGATPTTVKPSRGDRVYTVVQGDNPWVIAKKVYGSGAKYQAILDANGLTESSVLKVGTVLRIPGVDAAGNPIVVLSATATPILAPTTEDVAELEPTSPITGVTPVIVSTRPISKNTGGEQTMAELAINVLSFLFLVGAGVCGVFAFLYYRRSERVKKFETLAKRVRSTK